MTTQGTNLYPKGAYYMLSTSDVARELGVPQSSVSRFINKGYLVPDVTLHPSKTGRTGARKFKPETVKAFSESEYFRRYMHARYWR